MLVAADHVERVREVSTSFETKVGLGTVCCSFEPRRDTRARGRVRRRHSREPRDGEYAGAMPDGRGGVSALVRAAVASADASSLKVLDLSFNALVSLDDDGTPVEAGGCFASLPALEDLRVGDNALTTLRSSNLERLGDTLRSLRAQNNALRCLTGLEKMRALETLRVDGNASLGSPDIEQRTSLPGIPGVVNGLASLPSALTCLNLSRCALTSLDGFQNAACARRLEELRLDGNAFAAPNAFEPLRNCARLVELHVADARLTPASLAGLRALAPTLETLVLDGNPGLAERAKESSRMHTKKQLIRTTTPRRQIVKNDDARDVANALDDVGVLALRRAPRSAALTSLSVSRCGARALGPSGWSLADVAPKLERLDASRNRFATPAALGAARACAACARLRSPGTRCVLRLLRLLRLLRTLTRRTGIREVHYRRRSTAHTKCTTK